MKENVGVHFLFFLWIGTGKCERREFAQMDKTSDLSNLLHEEKDFARSIKYMRFPTMWHVRPTKPQMSLRIPTV